MWRTDVPRLGSHNAAKWAKWGQMRLQNPMWDEGEHVVAAATEYDEDADLNQDSIPDVIVRVRSQTGL